MSVSITVSRRVRTRALKTGLVAQSRYVLDYKDPATGRRRQEFFEKKGEAEVRRDALLRAFVAEQPAAARATQVSAPVGGPALQDARSDMTVGEIVEYWLCGLSGGLKESTRHYYRQMSRYVVDPTPLGTSTERRKWSRAGRTHAAVICVPGLGSVVVGDLTTQSIRSWHALLVEHVGHHTANAAKKLLGSALRLASEELGVRPPVLPRTPQRRKGSKTKKQTLSLAQVNVLLRAAWDDKERGLYYAFPFLTGVRPSEQLGLLWRDVDLGRGVITIRRMQELDGRLCDFTKTEASTREIPISPVLKQLLERWRDMTPTHSAADSRVFVIQGARRSARHDLTVGAPLTYWNFRNTYWRPVLRQLGLPNVAPHSARHTFISTLQAKGAEVGLVAKLAGHANPNITLGYYTQAVRDGMEPIAQLEEAYLQLGPANDDTLEAREARANSRAR